jgi:hypothetical protein
MRVYIPIYSGDIQLLKSEKPKQCLLQTSNLTVDEIVLVQQILKRFKVPVPEVLGSNSIEIPAPLEKAHKYVTRVLKKGKPTITAIKISEGRIEEVKTLAEAEEKLEKALAGKKGKKEKEAVTTTVPKRGCPMPVFDPMRAREIMATAVLWKFLADSQKRDFNLHKAITVFGGATGEKYLISHRHSRLAPKFGMVSRLVQGRRVPECVLETDLPAPEEMLSLLVVLSCPTTEEAWLASHV